MRKKDNLAELLRSFQRGKVSKGQLMAKLEPKYEKSPLFTELFNSLNEGASYDHLDHLINCIEGKEDYRESCFVQRHHSEHKKVMNVLSSYVSGRKITKPRLQRTRDSLSSNKPIDLLIHDVLCFIEKGHADKGVLGLMVKEKMDGNNNPQRYAKLVLKMLKGEAPYRSFTVCSRDNVYSVVWPV